jgi:pSer/pThr/pTyr-binding forkhead associated (FHA) protein
VRDRASRNGTFVDEIRVQGQSGVNNGQIVRLGRIEIRVEIEPPEEELTSLSAMDDFRKYERQSTGRHFQKVSIPITFTPVLSER